jgi:hypothetical protein
MAYFCKKCTVLIYITYLHGVLEMAIERGDKLLPVDRCPICANPLNARKDLKFIKTEEEK